MDVIYVAGRVPVAGSNQNHYTCPVKVADLTPVDQQLDNVQSIHPGKTHCIVRCSHGQVVFGSLQGDAIRDEDDERLKGVKVAFFDDKSVAKICCSPLSSTTFWLTQDGRVYGAGSNTDGQLGIYNTDPQSEPVLIDLLAFEKVIDIQSGSHHSVALTNTGLVYTCGKSTMQLDDRDNKGRLYDRLLKGYAREHIPVMPDAVLRLVSSMCGGTWTWKRVKYLQNIVQIAVGSTNSVFLNKYGEVSTCTRSQQPDDIQPPTRVSYFADNDIKISQIASGSQHIVALGANGKVYAWGSNQHGACGIPDSDAHLPCPQLVPSLSDEKCGMIKCGATHSYVRTQDGRHLLFGEQHRNEVSLNRSTTMTQWALGSDDAPTALGSAMNRFVQMNQVGRMAGLDMGTTINRFADDYKLPTFPTVAMKATTIPESLGHIADVYVGDSSTWIQCEPQPKTTTTHHPPPDLETLSQRMNMLDIDEESANDDDENKYSDDEANRDDGQQPAAGDEQPPAGGDGDDGDTDEINRQPPASGNGDDGNGDDESNHGGDANEDQDEEKYANEASLQTRLNCAYSELARLEHIVIEIKEQSIPTLKDIHDRKPDDELNDAIEELNQVTKESSERIIQRAVRPYVLEYKVERVGDDVARTIQEGDGAAKKQAVHAAKQMALKAKRTQSKGESKIKNIFIWSASYISDHYPLTVTTALVYATLIKLLPFLPAADMTEECSVSYQAARWGIFVLCLLYLFVALKGMYPFSICTTWFRFFKHIAMRCFVLILQLSMQSMLPLHCYVQDAAESEEKAEAYVMTCAIGGIVLLALLLTLLSSSKYKAFRSKVLERCPRLLREWDSPVIELKNYSERSRDQFPDPINIAKSALLKSIKFQVVPLGLRLISVGFIGGLQDCRGKLHNEADRARNASNLHSTALALHSNLSAAESNLELLGEADEAGTQPPADGDGNDDDANEDDQNVVIDIAPQMDDEEETDENELDADDDELGDATELKQDQLPPVDEEETVDAGDDEVAELKQDEASQPADEEETVDAGDAGDDEETVEDDAQDANGDDDGDAVEEADDNKGEIKFADDDYCVEVLVHVYRDVIHDSLLQIVGLTFFTKQGKTHDVGQTSVASMNNANGKYVRHESKLVRPPPFRGLSSITTRLGDQGEICYLQFTFMKVPKEE